jgi:hypothetical protein
MTPEEKLRVHVTVDVECAEERATATGVEPARGYELRVWGRLHNQREELGIPLVTRELDRVGLRGTFFVEPFGSSLFGEDGLAEVVSFLGGHDVQLHVHPVQRKMRWHSDGEARPSDDMADYGMVGQTSLLRDGRAILERCGAPGVVAFRAGNFGASNDTWRAMASVGLRVSSNFNLNYLSKNCRILWPEPANAPFDAGPVWELPITNFAIRGRDFRHLQVSAVSFPEMRHTLLEAHSLGLSDVTIVTHPFEYFFVDSADNRLGRPNPLNIERLRHLCQFLRDRSDIFAVETVGDFAARLEAGDLPDARRVAVVPRGRRTLRFGRMAEQAYKRLAARLPL